MQGNDTKAGENDVSFPEVVEQPVMWGYHQDLRQADKYKAIIDFDTGKLFSIVSQDYKLIRHEEAIEQMEDAIQESPALGKYKVLTAFYNDGGRMRRKYIFPEVEVEIKESDTVNPELHLYNSYDTAWPFIVLLGAFRFVCANGLVVGKKFLYLRKRHIYGLDQLNLQEQISTALERFELQTDQWKNWANRQLTVNTYKKVIETMKLGKRAMEEIEDRVDLESQGFADNGSPIMSLWIFFNILTWYITHRAVSLNHRVEMEKRLRVAMGHLRRK